MVGAAEVERHARSSPVADLGRGWDGAEARRLERRVPTEGVLGLDDLQSLRLRDRRFLGKRVAEISTSASHQCDCGKYKEIRQNLLLVETNVPQCPWEWAAPAAEVG